MYRHVFVSKLSWNFHKRVCPYDKAIFFCADFRWFNCVNIGPLVGLVKNTDIITKKTVVSHISKLNWFHLRLKWKIESRERPLEKMKKRWKCLHLLTERQSQQIICRVYKLLKISQYFFCFCETKIILK